MESSMTGRGGLDLVLPVALLASLGLLMAWLLPNHYFPWVTAYQEFAAFLAFLLLWSLCLWQGFRVPGIAMVFILAALVPLLQWGFGGILFFGDAIMASVYLSGFAVALGIGCSLGHSSSGQRMVLSGMAVLFIVAGVVSVWIAFRQWMMFPGSIWFADLPPGERPFANFAQPNNLAIFLCMGLMGVLYFYEARRLGTWASALIAVFLIMGVVLSESRTPWVVALVVCLFWFFKGRTTSLRLSFKALLAWVVFYLLLVMALPGIADGLLLYATDPLERAQNLHRWALWKQLGGAVIQGPWWGYGWNQVSLAQVAVSVVSPVPLMTDHSHNIVLDVLLWNGPWLGLLFLIVVGAWFLRLVIRVKAPEGHFAVMVALCLLVHGMLEYPLEYAFFLLPMGLLLGAVCTQDQGDRALLVPRNIALGLLAISVGLFAWIWHEYRVIEEDSRLMRFETAGIGFVSAEQAAPDVILLTQLREFTRFARTEAFEGMTQQEVEWMHRVASRFPYPPSLFRYVLALGLNGQPEEARQQLRVLQSLHSADHYAQAVENIGLMQERYPALKQVLAE